MRPVVIDRITWSVCHDHEPCKNGSTGQDAVWDIDLDGPKEPCIRLASRLPMGGTILRGEGVAHSIV